MAAETPVGETSNLRDDPVLQNPSVEEAVTTGNEQVPSDIPAEPTVGETSNMQEDPLLQNFQFQRNEKFVEVPSDDVVDPSSEEQNGEYPMSEFSDESKADSDEESIWEQTLYPLMLETDDLSDAESNISQTEDTVNFDDGYADDEKR